MEVPMAKCRLDADGNLAGPRKRLTPTEVTSMSAVELTTLMRSQAETIAALQHQLDWFIRCFNCPPFEGRAWRVNALRNPPFLGKARAQLEGRTSHTHRAAERISKIGAF
jgi:hypothetical protein